jgi:hypothetical protein
MWDRIVRRKEDALIDVVAPQKYPLRDMRYSFKYIPSISHQAFADVFSQKIFASSVCVEVQLDALCWDANVRRGGQNGTRAIPP